MAQITSIERRSESGAVRLETRTVLRVLFTILLVAAVLWLVYELAGVLLLLVLAVFFAYLIAPLVDIVAQRRRIAGRTVCIGRAAAIGVVYIALFGGVALVGNVMLPLLGNQLTQLVAQAPTYVNSARATMYSWWGLFNSANFPPSIHEPLQNALGKTMETVGQYASAGISGTLGLLAYLPWLVLIPILAFFLLKDATIFTSSVLGALPDGAARQRGNDLLRDLDRTLAAYIRAQLLACLLVGAICTIGFLIIGVPYALVLGVLAGLLEFIPLAGPVALAVFAIAVASFHSLTQAVIVLVFLAVLRVVQDYVIYPRLIGRGIHMHPLAVILAILAGADLAGVAGIFLAIPTVGVLAVILRHWLEYRSERLQARAS
jgi:predicted PurR-regulated permease PerM